MNPHEQPYGRWSQPVPRPAQFPQKPYLQESSLKTGEVQIERKAFEFALKENARGRLLRITENIGTRRNTIIVPASGWRDFVRQLDEMIEATNQLPPEMQKPATSEETNR